MQTNVTNGYMSILLIVNNQLDNFEPMRKISLSSKFGCSLIIVFVKKVV